MSEIEIVGGLTDHYTQVPNEIFRTPGIRSRAVHVFGNLRSHRSGWKTNIRNVAQSTGLSNNTVMAAINDLIELGYIEREQIPGTGGRFATYKYRVLDTPRLKNEDRRDPYQEVRQEPSQKVIQEPVAKSKTLKKNSSKNTKREDQSPLTPQGDDGASAAGEALDAHVLDPFEEWWEHVPRKKAKGDARKAFNTAIKKTDLPTLISGIEASKRQWQSEGRDSSKLPYPATWLRAESWEDEQDTWQTPQDNSNSLAAWGAPSTQQQQPSGPNPFRSIFDEPRAING